MQQANVNSNSSPQPAIRRTDSPGMEQAGANKESPAPPPQQSSSAEPAEEAGEGSGEGSVEMTLDPKSFRRLGEKTFTQRCRLFVGNIPLHLPEEEFVKLFSKYGKTSEVFINRDRGFGFIRLVSYVWLNLNTSTNVVKSSF